MSQNAVQAAPNVILRRLRAAAGLSQQEVAQRIGVLATAGGHPGTGLDANAISRWERGVNAPTPFYRRLLAELFGMSVNDLGFPQPDDPPVPQGKQGQVLGSQELTKAYATRGLVARPEWNSIIRGAQQDIWLYGMSELGYALDDEVPDILEEVAHNGCVIRILLLDPNYAGTIDIDTDEGSPPGTLAPRIRAALARFGQMRDRCGQQMNIRVYNARPTMSIVRGDGRMLVTPYLRFFVGSNSPTFELRNWIGSVDGLGWVLVG